tara:strand:- start:22229 stop:22384 length:156 start_codon:yes stop_codon:yes gene_type:complete
MNQSVIAYAEELRLSRARDIAKALYEQDKDNINLLQIVNDINAVLRELKNK